MGPSETTLIRLWRRGERQAQEFGGTLFYSEYRIAVCRPIRDYSFPKKTGAADTSV